MVSLILILQMLIQSVNFSLPLNGNMTPEGDTSNTANIDMNINLHDMNLIHSFALFLERSNGYRTWMVVLCDITMGHRMSMELTGIPKTLVR